MSVYDFAYLCIERSLLSVSIFGLECGREIWSGSADEIPNEIAKCELCSFDPPQNDRITLNIWRL